MPIRSALGSIRPALPAASLPAGGQALLPAFGSLAPVFRPAPVPVSSPLSVPASMGRDLGLPPGLFAAPNRPAALQLEMAAAPAPNLFSRSTFHPGSPEGEPDPEPEGFGGPEAGEFTGISSGETGLDAQPSHPDGVPEDMATLVLDKPSLGAGTSPWAPSVTGLRSGIDPASDAAVMLRVAAGDEAAFNFLVEKYHRPMIHFLYRMVHNQAVAEELAQEVFLRVYRARASYRAEARFSTWLYRIATNLAVNLARDTRHERAAQTVYLDAPDEETGTTPDVADDEMSVEERIVRNERMAAIRAHVMELPERQRMAVIMHKYQEMDYRQIGEVLKLSESATKSLLFRAYQTLRSKLKDFV